MILTDDKLEQIKRLTDVNDHSGALVLAAEALGQANLADRLKGIQRQHLARGYLTPDLHHDRYVLYREMLGFARANLDEANYIKLYAAF